jgi:hypothetical protein
MLSTTRTVLARFAPEKAAGSIAFLVFVYASLFYVIPFAIEHGNFHRMFSGGGPYVLLPLGWLAALIAFLPSVQFVWAVLFGGRSALWLDKGNLVYLSPLLLKLSIKEIVAVDLSSRRTAIGEVLRIAIATENGKIKYMPGGLFDEAAGEVVSRINRARMLTGPNA